MVDAQRGGAAAGAACVGATGRPPLHRSPARYAREGLRRSVDAVLVVHEHGHPHVLLLQASGAGGGAGQAPRAPSGGATRDGC